MCAQIKSIKFIINHKKSELKAKTPGPLQRVQDKESDGQWGNQTKTHPHWTQVDKEGDRCKFITTTMALLTLLAKGGPFLFLWL